jgi:NAD(P)-dependent dehydrogenase (short-subunit alcohol dehydrogenase family)
MTQPQQQQNHQPGLSNEMNPVPIHISPDYQGSNKLQGKFAIITGGDSGIGKAVALHFAKEGAHMAIVYLNEHEDAEQTKREIEGLGRHCMLFSGDVGNETFCQSVVNEVVTMHQKVDILVNNAAEQHPKKSIEEISAEQLTQTFKTNIFGYFFMTKASLKYMPEGSSIINTTSVTNYKGSQELLDYSATKGAITAFTRSLSQNLVEKKIRVNAIAPGPIWTPLIPSTFEPEKVEKFGEQVPMKRAGQPAEVAPSYVFLASNLDSSYITG